MSIVIPPFHVTIPRQFLNITKPELGLFYSNIYSAWINNKISFGINGYNRTNFTGIVLCYIKAEYDPMHLFKTFHFGGPL